MSNELILVNNTSLAMKEYNGQRVVTFKEIDATHKRKDGTADYNFRHNKQHFQEGVDYYKVPKNELPTNFMVNSKVGNPKLPIILITKSGYLMIVKSFTDKLSWNIQRQLVDNYFNPQVEPEPTPQQPESTAVVTADLTENIQVLEVLMASLKAQHAKNNQFEARIKALEEQKPKEIIVMEQQTLCTTPDEVVDGLFDVPKTLYTASSIAKVFGLSARELNRLLYVNGIHVPESRGWRLIKKYEDCEYVHQKMAHFNNRESDVLITYWTIKGKGFVCDFLKSKGLKQTGTPKKYNQHGTNRKSRKKKSNKVQEN